MDPPIQVVNVSESKNKPLAVLEGPVLYFPIPESLLVPTSAFLQQLFFCERSPSRSTGPAKLEGEADPVLMDLVFSVKTMF